MTKLTNLSSSTLKKFNLHQKIILHTADEILSWARETIEIEQISIRDLAGKLNQDFSDSVQLILNSSGRVVVTGIGKSANIGGKIVATLNSTGTPAIFMHAADAVHGDLGMIQNDDTIICISKSGDTPEIKALIPLLKMGGNTLIAMVGNPNSFLANNADKILDVGVDKEACPNNLAPTSSTTAQLVMGDALAVCLLKARGFTSRDFARFHPGGALGKRLYTTVQDIAKGNGKPQVQPDTNIKKVIVELTAQRLGAVVVVEGNEIRGIITDGDIRRMLEKYDNIGQVKARDIMNTSPSFMDESLLAIEAAKVMSEKKISQIIAVKGSAYSGMVHIHDLNREGILI
jgi:arabinose-5-phosphate isomerase